MGCKEDAIRWTSFESSSSAVVLQNRRGCVFLRAHHCFWRLLAGRWKGWLADLVLNFVPPWYGAGLKANCSNCNHRRETLLTKSFAYPSLTKGSCGESRQILWATTVVGLFSNELRPVSLVSWQTCPIGPPAKASAPGKPKQKKRKW
jgi:hypothetical protein